MNDKLTINIGGRLSKLIGIACMLMATSIPGNAQVVSLGGPPRPGGLAAKHITAESKFSGTRNGFVPQMAPTLPLTFVSNAGQAAPHVAYYSQGSGFLFQFTAREVLLTFVHEPSLAGSGTNGTTGILNGPATPTSGTQPLRQLTLALQFLGVNSQTKIEGHRRQPGKIHYLRGSDRSKWQKNIATYEEVVYRQLWPGIDMVFRGANGQLKYDFVVQPGVSVDKIRLAYRGAERLSLDEAGNLRIQTRFGRLIDDRPQTYQQTAGRQIPIGSRFVLDPARKRAFGFKVDTYDKTLPLVIDPGLVFSTYLGGRSTEFTRGIAVDPAGNIYVTTSTFSPDMPTTVGAYDRVCDRGTGSCFNGEMFVAKLDPTGSQLIYGTFLGGAFGDFPLNLAVDAAGNAYVVGGTFSANLIPAATKSFDRNHNPGFITDGFLAKLSPDGTNLLFATYFGGNRSDEIWSIAVKDEQNVFVVGFTRSPDFPVTPGAFDSMCDAAGACAQSDAFVAKFNTTSDGAAALVYSTFLGGSGFEIALEVAIDGTGAAVVGGHTSSNDFPLQGAFDSSRTGSVFSNEVFLTKINPAGSGLLYSSYLGGAGSESLGGVGIDQLGRIYAAGHVSSITFPAPYTTDFPTTPGAFDRIFNGIGEAYLVQIDPTMSGSASLLYSTFLGGGASDQVDSLAIESPGIVFLAGSTVSSDFPTTPGAFDRGQLTSFFSAFVATLDINRSRLLYGSYLGGHCPDVRSSNSAVGVATDGAGNAYITGYTSSSVFTTTPGAYDRTFNGPFSDMFVIKLATVPRGQIELLIRTVQNWTNAGTLNSGQANALTATLQSAIERLERGSSDTALNGLETFVGQLNAHIRAGTLSPSDGQPLIDETREIAEFVKYLSAL